MGERRLGGDEGPDLPHAGVHPLAYALHRWEHVVTDSDWLDAIEARLDAATDGPWEYRTVDMPALPWIEHEIVRKTDDRYHPMNVVKVREGRTLQTECCWWPTSSDAEFIANAPADIARLVKILRRVSALIPEWAVDLAEDQTWYAGPNISVSEAQELPAVIAVRKACIGALRAALTG